jgi:predicted nucleotidyltransferase
VAIGPSETLDRLVESVQISLGSSVTSLILHGSLSTDDYRPGFSDVDLLAIVRDPLSGRERTEIVDAAKHLATEDGPRFDLNAVTEEVAAHPTPAPVTELYVGWHPPPMIEPEVLGPAPLPDLAIELSICRQSAHSLVGPAADQLIGVVPSEWVIRIGDGYLHAWERVPFDPDMAEYMVFAACRVWMFHNLGRHGSKTEAAEWVQSQYPELVVVGVALRWRNQGGDDRAAEAQVMELIRRVRSAVTG